MVYPIIIFVAMAGVFVLLMVMVIPKLADMYTSMHVDLPVVTKIMIGISNFFVHQWYVVLLIVGSVFFVVRWFATSPSGKYFLTELTFKLPVFGKINKFKEQSQFTRTLALLISAAVPIVEALNIVSNVVQSNAYKVAAQNAAKQVEKGNSLSGFFKNTPIFPPLIGQMAGVGEETGKMDEVLDRVAGYYDLEVDNMIKGLSAALEPMILVILGVMVAFMIISIITPIYKLTTSIGS
jgi:type IV pilus assembly protein PilC